jgi:hypothetical protein
MHILIYITAILLIAALMFLPNYWVTHVIRKYQRPDNLFPGTGGELAKHLLERFGITNAGVEEGEPDQDHYDPQERMVRLSPENYHGHSLSAITIAAHEVGHAIQHHNGYPLFTLRTHLVRLAIVAGRVGSVAIMATPLLGGITRSPTVALVTFLLGISGIAVGTLVHLVTLPVEWNASFSRAMPILVAGEYIDPGQQPHAHKILKAAALTYVAGSLASIINLYRWIAILRR